MRIFRHLPLTKIILFWQWNSYYTVNFHWHAFNKKIWNHTPRFYGSSYFSCKWCSKWNPSSFPLSIPPFTDSLLQDRVSPLLSRGLLHYHLTTKAAADGHTQNSARLWAGLWYHPSGGGGDQFILVAIGIQNSVQHLGVHFFKYIWFTIVCIVELRFEN